MPVIPMRSAEYVIVQAALPGGTVENVGVFLIDPDTNTGHLRFRRDWEEIAEEEDAEVLRELPDDLALKMREMGAGELLAFLEDKVSNTIRLTERESVVVEDCGSAADRLYRKHVAPKVLPFRTHLPLYSLRAAAGKFGESMEVEPEDWVETPERLRLTEDMFVAHVSGRSMEPKIPDGSLCVFRYNVTGSRQGKFVLVMNYGEAGENRFTIKRYTSAKLKGGDGTWEHGQIRLEPLNPEYEAWDLDPEDTRLKIVGEFVAVLSGPPEET